MSTAWSGPVRLVPHGTPGTILRAAALGAATGSRSTAGVTAIALTSDPDDSGVLASKLGTTAGKVVTTTAAAAELAVDKMPATPSRLTASGLVPRLALGATSTAAMAQREKADRVLPGLVGLVGLAASAFVWTRVRAVAARRFGSDLPAAFAEDAVAALLSWLGTRRAPQDAVTTAEPMTR